MPREHDKTMKAIWKLIFHLFETYSFYIAETITDAGINISGAHTGFFNGRGTGLQAALGPKVTPPEKQKLL